MAIEHRPSTSMGAHESNKGLCAALLRAFATYGCTADAGKEDASPRCTGLLERMIARGCQQPSESSNVSSTSSEDA